MAKRNRSARTQQKQMQRAADARVLSVCRTFNEIQTGPNPLTQAEIDRLVAKRPDVYGVLNACTTTGRRR